MDLSQIDLHPSWMAHLASEFEKPYMHALVKFLATERKRQSIFPPKGETFAALNLCPFDQVKVVIFGQDPYHGPGQAHGLCFSVRPGVPIPPSLKNVYRELQEDIGAHPPNHGHLKKWAQQGVLLLNAVLTVRQGQAASHRNQGWEHFTDAIVQALNLHREGLVFLLWGNDAKKKGRTIDRTRHLVLESGHPSPLSVRHFRGNHHFSRSNRWLQEHGQGPIEWQL